MNVEVKLLVRLLCAILLLSLISTLFLGKHIHKHIVESVKKHKLEPTDISSGNETPLEISLEFPGNYHNGGESTTDDAVKRAKRFESLKIHKHGLYRLLKQNAVGRNWIDREAMMFDRHRTGLGEKGEEVITAESNDAGKKLLGLHGFHAQLSDLISVNRSLPDFRPKRCSLRKYQAKLPSVTVVIAFHNEHPSVLLRSIHSLVNRSPAELLREIILVDDASQLPDLGKKLDNYVAKAFGKIVSLVRLLERHGLIKARMEGARRATCQVLVFLDSHIEATHGWLPPLLGPIATHRTIATGPIVDAISRETFAYNAGSKHSRTGFNWRLHVKHLPRFREESYYKHLPFRTPLLVGAMAIDRKYFWQLGGYDEELDIWGGEYLEMGFKIWMCGGMLLYTPCSRVGHISRGPVLERSSPRNYNFLGRNYKRVAEVWMDDYKKIVYKRNPKLFHNVDAGNLARLKARRKQLNCESFDWYMTKVAPDFLAKFPIVELAPLASGVIQSVAYPSLCIDTLNVDYTKSVGLAPCRKPPTKYQDWTLTHENEIQLKTGLACLEEDGSNEKNASVSVYHCHSMGGNQFWYYNPNLKWIQLGKAWHRCLEAIPPNGPMPGRVVTNFCLKSNRQQRWNFGGP